MIANYKIQEWLLSTVFGRYDVDLAESGVQFQRMKDIDFHSEWSMDYSLDRGSEFLRKEILTLYGEVAGSHSALIAHGAQEALYLFYRSFLAPEDHIVSILPGWQQSWEVPKAIGCHVSLFPWTPGSSSDRKGLEAVLQSNTKLIILNSPCNPSGQKLTDAERDALVEIAKKHNIWILNDEEYVLDFSESIVHKYTHSISVSRLSKVYGLPSLRIGWAVSSHELIEKMVNYKRYTTVSNSLICENAACGVLKEREVHLERYKKILEEGRLLLDAFSDMTKHDLEMIPPHGTPFVWFNLKRQESSMEFVERLLEAQKVLLMPAEVFGIEKGVRLSYARDLSLLRDGLNRIISFLGVRGTL